MREAGYEFVVRGATYHVMAERAVNEARRFFGDIPFEIHSIEARATWDSNDAGVIEATIYATTTQAAA